MIKGERAPRVRCLKLYLVAKNPSAHYHTWETHYQWECRKRDLCVRMCVQGAS